MKIILIVIALHLFVSAKDSQSNWFYVGVDYSPIARGYQSYGSSGDAADAVHYNVDTALLYKLGLIINNFLRVEYGHNTFKSKKYGALTIPSLEMLLTFKFLSTRRLFDTPYTIYPSLEGGLQGMMPHGGINLHYEIGNSIEALLSWRHLEKLSGIGGGADSVTGAYLGMRYKF